MNIKRQEGQILAIVIVFLFLGGIITSALLSFASSGLKQGTVIEDRTTQLYAAQAGVESAWQKINSGDTNLPSSGDPPWSYHVDNFANNLQVNVTITYSTEVTGISRTFLVHSVYTAHSGKSTVIDATLIAQKGSNNYFFDNSFTTKGDLYCKNKVEVNGFVQCGWISFKVPDFGPNPNPPPALYGDRGIVPTVWPTAQDLRDYYLNLIHNTHASGWTISSQTTLTTTEYVTGTCNINADINLNGQTLFVDGTINLSNGVSTVTGPGCIVATGDINYNGPKTDVGQGPSPGPAEGVLTFSLGTVNYKPSGTYWGWIAGETEVNIFSGSFPNYNWTTADLASIHFLEVGDVAGPFNLVTITTMKITNQ